ncbi:MAG: PBP1A family penicillin-binding protein [Gemmatimonadetes bacterium]|nr:PBP1A family penicillin-binding protein [Gemmatimonadota bacterium]
MFYRERRQLISVADLPRHVTMAFVSIEDRRFYDHEGVDFVRLVGAIRDNVFSGFGASGASTISMQLARNLFPEQLPRGEKTFRRKIAEARLALTMERRFAKDEILELYLNHIYLGAGAYGLEAAARTYFDKPAAELTITEAATLAGLPQAPSGYNPRRNPRAAHGRRNIVLDWMVQTGTITAAEGTAAKEAPLGLAPPSGVVRAPYFVEHVRRELEDKLGELLYTGGLRIYTTVDAELQEEAESALEEHLRQVEGGSYGSFRHTSYARFSEQHAEDSTAISHTPYLQGAVVVMEPHTGYVLAMVGGRDFNHSQFNRATQALRQPGSAFKPYVYAAALEAGRSPLYQVSDAPLFIQQSDGSTWAPRNYSGEYGGNTSLREALRQSKNMVAIRLGQEVGIEAVRDVARRTGLDTEIPGYPSVYIGAAGVYPVDMIASYATFANGGMKVEPRYIKRIEDGEGRLLWDPGQPAVPTMDPAVSWIMTDMLREVVDRGTGYNVRNPAIGNVPYSIPAAGKTGTTNGNTDVWFVGYTPDLVAGVWLGLDQPRTITSGATGGGFAVPVWARVVRKYYENREAPSPWERPDNVVVRNISSWTGKAVTADCPYIARSYTDYFVGSAAPVPGCDPPEIWSDPHPHLPGTAIEPGQPRVPRPEDFLDNQPRPARPGRPEVE